MDGSAGNMDSKDQKLIDPSLLPEWKPDEEFNQKMQGMIANAKPDNSPEAVAFSKYTKDLK